MHEILTIYQTTYKRIWDRKSIRYGAESDHVDVPIKLAITSIKFKLNTFIKGVIDWINIVTGEVYEDSYCDTLKYLLDESTSYDKFNECILKSGKKLKISSNISANGVSG